MAANKNKFFLTSFILLFYLIFILFSCPFISFSFPSSMPLQGPNEQELLEEILSLDSKIHALKEKINFLNHQKEELNKALLRNKREIKNLDNALKEKRRKLSSFIIFAYKGGFGTFLAVLAGSETLGEFLRRLDNIIFITEYYNSVIDEMKTLIVIKKQEEAKIMENQKRITKLEEETKNTLLELEKAKIKKEYELARAKKFLKDPKFLEELSKNWQVILPSLDYLLKNLTALPWTSISPDRLQVNYFTLTAKGEFFEKSLTEKLLSGREELKSVFFAITKEGIIVSEKDKNGNIVYSVTCTMELTNDGKIKFNPVKLEFNGVTLPPEVIKDLLTGYDLSFTPPPLPYELKISSIETDEGKLIMYFKK